MLTEAAPLNRMAIVATLHCLMGCAIGEILGMIIGTAANFSNFQTVILATALAFTFGYTLSTVPLIRSRMTLKNALVLVLLADTLSIAAMEIVDNLVILAIPGAMEAMLDTILFWASLGLSLVAAFIVAVPVNRFLLSKNKGHALTHGYHHKDNFR